MAQRRASRVFACSTTALTSHKPQQAPTGRRCTGCGIKLSRYNLDGQCSSCARKKWEATC